MGEVDDPTPDLYPVIEAGLDAMIAAENARDAAAKAGTIDRAGIVAGLEARGARRSIAAQYADAYLEYREASANIAANGSMVLHPRTANPIANPYLELRERALVKLQKMRGVPADWLW